MMKYASRGRGNCFDGGDLVREYLHERYMSQYELADKIKIDPSKLSEFLNGFKRPSKKELENIMDVLGIDLAKWMEQSSYVREAFQMDDPGF